VKRGRRVHGQLKLLSEGLQASIDGISVAEVSKKAA